ncbi:homoserine kinase, partial [Streptococcus danieliae]|nr:homoserine kinase [Streptococcus danieliae]
IGLILKAFENYDLDILKRVMGDRIHEPYRKKIIYEYDEVKEICEKVDSISFLISGSGSTLLNIYENLDSAEIIREKLSKLENDWQVLELQIDKEGTVIL